jgi:hypothetical protein
MQETTETLGGSLIIRNVMERFSALPKKCIKNFTKSAEDR